MVSALAPNCAEHYRRLLAGESGLVEQPVEDGLPVKTWAPAWRDRYGSRIENRMLRKLLQPSAAMAVLAAGQALTDAGLRNDAERLERTGLFIGSVSFELPQGLYVPALDASLNTAGQFDFKYFAQRGMAALDPLLIVKGLPNAGLCGISIEFGVLGPNLNIANDSMGGLQAVAAAMAAIVRGDAEIAVAGAMTLYFSRST